VLGAKARRGWERGPDGQFRLVMDNGRIDRPGYQRVDYWSFFPDPDARTIAESAGNYIRHLMKPQQLRRLARMNGFDADANRSLLKDGSRETAPQYLVDLRSIIAEDQSNLGTDFFHVWEYNGPLDADAMACLAEVMGDEETRQDASEMDPLDDMQAV